MRYRRMRGGAGRSYNRGTVSPRLTPCGRGRSFAIMSHSVRRHLGVDTDAYDRAIARFIPGYGAMIGVAADAAAGVRPRRVLDLGAGTGVLSLAILERHTGGRVDLVDIDRGMLDLARSRLAPFGDRVRFRLASFGDALPRLDAHSWRAATDGLADGRYQAVVASLALHHVPTLEAKRYLYRRIHAALVPGGRFVNADATIPREPEARRRTFDAWADQMAEHGISRRRAFEHFDAWAEEDTYFSLGEELAAMRDAGFGAECVWRDGPMSVLVGKRRVGPAGPVGRAAVASRDDSTRPPPRPPGRRAPRRAPPAPSRP